LYNISQIASVINAGTFPKNAGGHIQHILLDSRKLLFPSTSLFFALGSQRRNGNVFIKDLYYKGVRNFVVDEHFSERDIQQFREATFLQVGEVMHALQALAAFHRQQFAIPVIGITGSNGKTIVKEWLYQLLQSDFNIVRSPKSYNSQIGVPLSVWQMNAANTLGIFEAGISMQGEMQRLEKIIKPTIGIFTNIGEAHSEGFESTTEKINEKIKLFVNSGTVVYCKDEDAVDEAMKQLQQKNNTILFNWGHDEDAALCIKSTQVQPFNTVIKALYKEKKISISIPFTNDAAIKNAITCWCILLYLKIDDELIQERMLQLNR
jgi:Alr-MurF fusion protein